MNKTFSLCLCLLVAVSCSIKEDRTGCPCWLQVDPTQLDRPAEVFGWGIEMLFNEKVTSESPVMEYTVPRGMVAVTAIGPTRHKSIERKLEILPGYQADSLYGHSSRINTQCEMAYDILSLKKQFATIALKMDIPSGHEVYPYCLHIKSNTGGWMLDSLEGMEGEFDFTPQLEDTNTFTFRVPRQRDRSMTVDVIDGDYTIETIKLGEMIERAGFDWHKDSLEDITLQINLSDYKVEINITGWESTILMDVII